MDRVRRDGAAVGSEEREDEDDATPSVTRSNTPGANPIDVIGRLAAELSHDLNNDLAAVLNYTFILERQVEGPLREHVVELREAAWRASARARSLKLFGNTRRGELSDLAVDGLLYDLRQVLARVAGELSLRIDLPISLPLVRGSLSAVERLAVALGAVTAARTPLADELVLYARQHAGRLRLGCRAEGGIQSEPAPPRSSWAGESGFGRAVLHDVIKRAGARLGHDEQQVWADLPIA